MGAGEVTARDNQPNPRQGTEGARIRCGFSRDTAGGGARNSLVPSSQRAGGRACRRHLVSIAKSRSLTPLLVHLGHADPPS